MVMICIHITLHVIYNGTIVTATKPKNTKFMQPPCCFFIFNGKENTLTKDT